MVHSEYISLSTRKRCCWVDITGEIQAVITQTGFVAGICTVVSMHTTAGITINENADPDVATDFFSHLASMVPRTSSFNHVEGNSDSHIKTSLVGNSVQLVVVKGRLVLGTWQSIYFSEFDGPRNRRCVVNLIGDLHAASNTRRPNSTPSVQ